MRERGPLALRISLGVVFVWFGLLKVLGISPVADMVVTTLRWIEPYFALVGLGIVEIALGLGLLTGVALRGVLAILWVQLAGTFLVFVLQPALAFRGGNPFLLTVEGEFIVKNLVLIAAGIVVGGEARRLPRLGGRRATSEA